MVENSMQPVKWSESVDYNGFITHISAWINREGANMRSRDGAVTSFDSALPVITSSES